MGHGLASEKANPANLCFGGWCLNDGRRAYLGCFWDIEDRFRGVVGYFRRDASNLVPGLDALEKALVQALLQALVETPREANRRSKPNHGLVAG